jgi:hypothetical protein
MCYLIPILSSLNQLTLSEHAKFFVNWSPITLAKAAQLSPKASVSCHHCKGSPNLVLYLLDIVLRERKKFQKTRVGLVSAVVP